MTPPLTGDTCRAVVLLSTTDHIGFVVGSHYPVELSSRIVLRSPRPATVEGDISAAVIAVDHSIGIARRNPKVMVVTVGDSDALESFTTVSRTIQSRVQRIHDFGVLRIGINASVVECPLTQHPLIIHEVPGRTSVIGTVDSTVFSFDQRPHSVRCGR